MDILSPSLNARIIGLRKRIDRLKEGKAKNAFLNDIDKIPVIPPYHQETVFSLLEELVTIDENIAPLMED